MEKTNKINDISIHIYNMDNLPTTKQNKIKAVSNARPTTINDNFKYRIEENNAFIYGFYEQNKIRYFQAQAEQPNTTSDLNLYNQDISNYLN